MLLCGLLFLVRSCTFGPTHGYAWGRYNLVKPCPFGNEYHNIFFGLIGIMFDISLVEGKDNPREISPDKYDKIGNMVSLLVRIFSHIYSTCNVE